MKEYLGARVSSETKQALKEYAARHNLRIGEAMDKLLQYALTAPIDEASEQLIMPHLRRVLADVLVTEMRTYTKAVFTELTGNYERSTAAILRGQLTGHTDRLAALAVNSGKEAAAARRMAANIAMATIQPDIRDLEREADEYAGKRTANWRKKDADDS